MTVEDFIIRMTRLGVSDLNTIILALRSARENLVVKSNLVEDEQKWRIAVRWYFLQAQQKRKIPRNFTLTGLPTRKCKCLSQTKRRKQ